MDERGKVLKDEVHTDVWGPAQTATKKGKCYYVTFMNDYSCWTYIEFLKCKSKVFDAYKQFEAWFDTQFGVHIKLLHLDEDIAVTHLFHGRPMLGPCSPPQTPGRIRAEKGVNRFLNILRIVAIFL